MRHTSLPRATEALPTWHVGVLDEPRVAPYLAASLDENPLHRDAKAAAAAGLDQPIVPGILFLGLFEQMIRAWRADLRIARLSARFLAPVPMGEAVTVAGRVVQVDHEGGGPRIVLRLFIRTAEDRIACIGEAFARPIGLALPDPVATGTAG